MKYIIYAGGSSGYQLYGGSPDFPKEYSDEVAALYANGGILKDPADKERDYRCFRFAPLKDCYLFSVIYKGYSGNGDARGNYATVNWLLDSFEADSFFESDYRKGMVDVIAASDSIIVDLGYEIPLNAMTLKEDFLPTDNAKCALFAAAYHSTLRAENEKIKVQTYVGCSREYDILNHLCWLYDRLPSKMRRLVSFHAGASSASETGGVVLVLIYDDLLGPMNRNDGFFGAPMVDRMILTGDAFGGSAALPEAAVNYMRIPDPKKDKLLDLLSNSHAELFWDLVNTEDYNQLFSPAKLVSALPEEFVMGAIRRGIFAQEDLKKLYNRRDEFPHLPRVMEMLSEVFREKEIEKKEKGDILVPHIHKNEEERRDPGVWIKGKGKKRPQKNLLASEKKSEQAPDPVDSEAAVSASRKAEAPSAEKMLGIKPTKGLRLFLMLTFVVQILLLLVNLGLVAYLLGIGFIAHLSGKTAVILFALLIAILIVATVPLGFVLLSILDKFSEK